MELARTRPNNGRRSPWHQHVGILDYDWVVLSVCRCWRLLNLESSILDATVQIQTKEFIVRFGWEWEAIRVLLPVQTRAWNACHWLDCCLELFILSWDVFLFYWDSFSAFFPRTRIRTQDNDVITCSQYLLEVNELATLFESRIPKHTHDVREKKTNLCHLNKL
jgi:hypothetical protein